MKKRELLAVIAVAECVVAVEVMRMERNGFNVEIVKED
jgi:hypothetical protein